jgi:glucose-1-phosphate cytidylyltransferase
VESIVKAVILSGGLGTRLREETEFRPKPMVDVGGKPVLWHIMKLFAHYRITDFVVPIGYRGQVIKEYFLNYEGFNNDFTIRLGRAQQTTFHTTHQESDWNVTVAETGLETNTGGRVKRVQRYVDGDTFMVTYGDGLADVDLDRLLAFHAAHGRLATMTTVKPMSRFGVVDLGGDDAVESFREKPQVEDWISGGFFVFDRRVFDHLDEECVLEQAPLEQLAKDGQLMAYRHNGFWQPMDTYREFVLLNEMWDSGRAPWKVWAE